MLGSTIGNAGNYQSVSAIQSWVQSRPDLEPVTTIDPIEADAIEADPFNLLFDDGLNQDEIIENYQNADGGDGDQEGDIFPMYHTRYPPDQVAEVASAYTSEYNPISYFTGFTALLGQVWLRIDASVQPNVNMPLPGLITGITPGTAKVDIVLDVNPKGMKI